MPSKNTLSRTRKFDRNSDFDNIYYCNMLSFFKHAGTYRWKVSLLVLLRNLQIPKLLILLHHHQTPSFISDPIQTNSITSNTRHTHNTHRVPYRFLCRISRELTVFCIVCLRARGRQQVILHHRKDCSYRNTNIHTYTTSPVGLRMPQSQMARGQQRQGRWSSSLLHFPCYQSCFNAGVLVEQVNYSRSAAMLTLDPCYSSQSAFNTHQSFISNLLFGNISRLCVEYHTPH